MKLVIQRVKEASCLVSSKITGKIGVGFMILVGIAAEDERKDAEYLAKKVAKLRVFDDEEGKMNNDLRAVQGAVLSISQFTLLADTRKGNRPSFVKAMRGEDAKQLYEYFNEQLRAEGYIVQTGIFGADMQISLVNDGPVTILMESEK